MMLKKMADLLQLLSLSRVSNSTVMVPLSITTEKRNDEGTVTTVYTYYLQSESVLA